MQYTEPVFLNLLRGPGIDSQPSGIDFWAPNTGSGPDVTREEGE
jgi:hypothetical protein